MCREANATGKAEKRLGRARKALEAKREAREELVEQLAALDAELEDKEAFRGLEAESQAAAEGERLRKAAELPERSHVPGLLTQLRGLQAARRGNFECAWSEIEKQMSAVAAQLALGSAPPSRDSWAESCPIDDELGIRNDDAPLASAADKTKIRRVWPAQPAAMRGQGERFRAAAGPWPCVSEARAAAAVQRDPQQWGRQASDLEVGQVRSLPGPRCGCQVGLPLGQSGPRGDSALAGWESTTGVGQVAHPAGQRGSGQVGPPRGQPDPRGSSALVGSRSPRRVADSAQPCISPLVRPGTQMRPPGDQEEGRCGGIQPHVVAAPTLGGGREAQQGGPSQLAGGARRVAAADAIIWGRVCDLDPTAQAPTVAFAEALASGLVVLGCNGSGWRRSLEVLEGYARLVGAWPHVVTLQETRLLATSKIASAFGTAGALGLELMVASAYFEHIIGPWAGNLDLLRAVAQLTMAAGCTPWLLQADFNMEPATLQELSWPECHRAVAIAPWVPTCFAAKQEKTFDWFVASQDLAYAASTCRPAPGLALHPHTSVELTLQDLRPDALVQVLKNPRPFPHRDINACEAHEDARVEVFRRVGRAGKWQRGPLEWCWQPGERPRSLELGLRQWMAAAERALIGTHDIDEQHALTRRRHRVLHAAVTYELRCLNDLAQQRIKAEVAEKYHASHEGWYSTEAHRRCKRLVIELEFHPRQILLLPTALQEWLLDLMQEFEGAPLPGRRTHNTAASRAQGQGMATASLFVDIDISKFYENARHDVLWEVAVQHTFNLTLLRGLLASYQSPRCVAMAELCTVAFTTSGAILAGCACATALANLPMLGPPLAMTVGRPLICPRNAVDDVPLQAIGTERLAVQQLSEAGAQLVSMLMAQHLPVNAAKTHLLASTPTVAGGLKERWQLHVWSFSQELQARNFGIDACMARRRVAESAARARQSLRSGRRMQSMKAAGVRVDAVFETGPSSSFLWGRAVVGIPVGDLRSMRIAACRSAGRLHNGEPLGPRLCAAEALRGRDLGPEAVAAGRAASMAAAVLQSACGDGPLCPRVHCRSPVDALILTLGRIGWGVRGTDLVADFGGVLGLTSLGPKDLMTEAEKGARRASDRRELGRLANGGRHCHLLFWDAICELIGPRGSLGHREKAGFVSVFTNARWPQQRLLAAKVSEDGTLEAASYGTVRADLCPQQTAKNAEDFASWMLTEVAGSGRHILHVDCASTVPCLRRGRRCATGIGRPGTHLWSRFFAVSGPEDYEVRRVPAHLARAQVQKGRVSEQEWGGNRSADIYAKLGPSLHAVPREVLVHFKAFAPIVAELARRIAQVSILVQQGGLRNAQGLPEGLESCSRCGAYAGIDGGPKLHEECLGCPPKGPKGKGGRDQLSLWDRGLHPSGRRGKKKAVRMLRQMGVTSELRGGILAWFGALPEEAGPAAADAPAGREGDGGGTATSRASSSSPAGGLRAAAPPVRRPAAAAAPMGTAEAAISRPEAMLAVGLDESGLADWAQEVAAAEERKRRRLVGPPE
ncbi:unnamed protein product [Prorocentrum cordatum]|uniref:Rhodanese domain-containing protein n=1 Tax=Prorocentrum cordatum TaxID=2364126 RepID=A0ABN9PAS3_9DINO|nr:unnamed protein product [Polarella glacialis]